VSLLWTSFWPGWRAESQVDHEKQAMKNWSLPVETAP
jgi:hypothetical protein